MKKFICIMFCLVLALSVSAMNISAVDYTPPPKMEKAIFPVFEAPVIVETPAVMIVNVQYLNLDYTNMVVFCVKDAPVTSQMAAGYPMYAYIEKRGFYKRFHTPNSKNEDERQQMRNMSRYHNKYKH